LLTHGETKTQYRIKRHAPEVYFGMMMRAVRKLMN